MWSRQIGAGCHRSRCNLRHLSTTNSDGWLADRLLHGDSSLKDGLLNRLMDWWMDRMMDWLDWLLHRNECIDHGLRRRSIDIRNSRRVDKVKGRPLALRGVEARSHVRHGCLWTPLRFVFPLGVLLACLKYRCSS